MDDGQLTEKLVIAVAIAMVILVMFAFLSLFPVYPASGLSIMTVGDISCNHESLTTMNNMLAYLKNYPIDRFVFLGDAQYSGSYAQCVEGFFKEVTKYTTLRMVIGNHDTRGIWKNITNTFPTISKQLVWNETIGETLLIGLNTNKPWNATSDQYKQVENILDTQVAEYTLVFQHKHMINACRPDKDPFMCGYYELYHPLFKKFHVDCVITGHLHMIAMLHNDGMCYGIYGMGGATPYAINKIFTGSQVEYKSVREHGFTVLHEAPNGMMHTFYTNNGDIIRKHFGDIK